jgi:hypothetical protein
MYNSDIKREQEISRITAEEASMYVSQKENVFGYPVEFFTLTPNRQDSKWEDVTYYTGKRKATFNASFTNDYAYWIYVLSNPAMPDLLKIGFTVQNPETRAAQISAATGVALPFKLEYAFQCHNGAILEREIHLYLESYRVSTNREFFKIDLKEVISAIEKLGDKYINLEEKL